MAVTAAQAEPLYSSVVPAAGGVNPVDKVAVVVPHPYLPQPELFKFGAAVQLYPSQVSLEFVAPPGVLPAITIDAV